MGFAGQDKNHCVVASGHPILSSLSGQGDILILIIATVMVLEGVGKSVLGVSHDALRN